MHSLSLSHLAIQSKNFSMSISTLKLGRVHSSHANVQQAYAYRNRQNPCNLNQSCPLQIPPNRQVVHVRLEEQLWDLIHSQISLWARPFFQHHPCLCLPLSVDLTAQLCLLLNVLINQIFAIRFYMVPLESSQRFYGFNSFIYIARQDDVVNVSIHPAS